MTKWNGLCPAGKHGLDHKGQHCNLCDKPHPSADSPGGQRNIVGGERMERTVVDFVHACEVEVERIAASPFGDNAVLALLCDSVRLAREHVAMFQADPRDAELSSLRERLAGAEEQSEARRRALLAVGDERRVEWTRAEKAESERDAALAKFAEAEDRAEGHRIGRVNAEDACVNLDKRIQELAIAREKLAEAERKGEESALNYIDGWIEHKFACYPTMYPAARAMLDDMRVHVRAAVERLKRGDGLEATSQLMSPVTEVE
jgi:hypothetical protein